MSINSMLFDISSVEELMKSPFAKFITSAKDCGYSRSTIDLIVSWVHTLFLKAKAVASKVDNTSWLKAMHDPFEDEYRKAAVTEVKTL